jgi:biopolymer transport protein TolR
MLAAQSVQIRSEINITPLVDVVLVLLIIFMVITPLLQQGYEVVVPKTSPRRPLSEAQFLLVSVTRQGSILFNGEAVGLDRIRERLLPALRQSTSKTVFLSADEEVNYGSVVLVLDRIRNAGAEHIGIALTSPEHMGL